MKKEGTKEEGGEELPPREQMKVGTCGQNTGIWLSDTAVS